MQQRILDLSILSRQSMLLVFFLHAATRSIMSQSCLVRLTQFFAARDYHFMIFSLF